MICLCIEIHHYRLLARFNPQLIEQLGFGVGAAVKAGGGREYSGVAGGYRVFAFGEGQRLSERPRELDAVLSCCCDCEQILRSRSAELYGYKLLLEEIEEQYTELVTARLLSLLQIIPEVDALWLTPQLRSILDRSEVELSGTELSGIEFDGNWARLEQAEEPGANAAHIGFGADERSTAYDHAPLREQLLDRIGCALNRGFASEILEFRGSSPEQMAKELRAGFRRFCGELDDTPCLTLVGSPEFTALPFDCLRRAFAALDHDWLQEHLPLTGRRILRDILPRLGEHRRYRFVGDPVLMKSYKVALGLVSDSFARFAHDHGVPFLVILQAPESIDPATKAVLEYVYGRESCLTAGRQAPIVVIVRRDSARRGIRHSGVLRSFYCTHEDLSTTAEVTLPAVLQCTLSKVLSEEEIRNVAGQHRSAVQEIALDSSAIGRSYDSATTEVRRLRSAYGDTLYAHYLARPNGVHAGVISALVWSGRHREALALWNGLLNAAIECGCAEDARALLANPPALGGAGQVKPELVVSYNAARARLTTLGRPDDSVLGKSPPDSVPVVILERQMNTHRDGTQAAENLDWILACADKAAVAGDIESRKQYAKVALIGSQEAGDRDSAGRAQIHLAEAFLLLGRLNEAREYASRARQEAQHNQFKVYEQGWLIEGCAHFLDGNLTRVGEILDTLRERENDLTVPAALRVFRQTLGFRHALELGRSVAARKQLSELRQFLDSIGESLWATTLRSWDLLCEALEREESVEEGVEEEPTAVKQGYFMYEPVSEIADCPGLYRDRCLLSSLALLSVGRAGEALERLSAVSAETPQRTLLARLRAPRLFALEDYAIGPGLVFERLQRTCNAVAMLQRGRSADAVETMGVICREPSKLAVDPFRSLYLLVYSSALSRSRGPDDPDPSAVLGQAVRVLRERSARIESPKERLEFQRANPINRRLIQLARRYNLW